MQRLFDPFLLLPWLTAGLVLASGDRLTAQTFTTLRSFSAGTGLLYANSDGAHPWSGLMQSGGILYGTALSGGVSGSGTVFKVNTDGTDFTTLHSFTALSGSQPSTNNDGNSPTSGLMLSGNTLYGTAPQGGTSGYGTVFKVNTDGTGFAILHGFTAASAPHYTNSDGGYPNGGVILVGNTLYGTAAGGGSAGNGTVFKVNTDGTGFGVLHSFSEKSSPPESNGDGSNPYGGLVLSGNILYGTAVGGGSANKGTVFSVNTDGTGFRALHDFGGGSDGASPWAGLVLSGNTLYGTATGGGNEWGTVFRIHINGTGYATLHRFSVGTDGGAPYARLLVSNNTLYGTTEVGGGAFNGTVFRVNTDGSGFTNIYGFSAQSSVEPYTNSDGASPKGGLVMSDSTLYGTTPRGGAFGSGTIFRVALPAPASFAEWAEGYGLSGDDAAAGSDPDRDRLPNGAEYILGGNPTGSGSTELPAASVVGANGVLRFSRVDSSETPDVEATVETGPDLATWPDRLTIGATTAASSSGVSVTENGAAPDTITVTIPPGIDQATFARLNVTITL